MGHYTVTPSDPELAPMFTLAIHKSLGDGIVEAGALSRFQGELSETDAITLEEWAAFRCEHPHGQRASFARALASLIRLASGVRCDWVPTPPPGGPLDHVGR